MEEKKKSRRKVTWIVCISIFTVLVAAAIFFVWNPPYLEEPLETGIEVDESKSFSLGADWNPGPPIVLAIDNPDFPTEEISFECSTELGELLRKYPFVSTKELTVANHSKIYWNSIWSVEDCLDPALDVVYIRVIVRCEGHIIGYAVVRLDREYSNSADTDEEIPTAAYFERIIKAVYFPKVLGCYQPVAQKYVERCMQEIIDAQ